MIRVGIFGATGYTGLELIKILLQHPECKITALLSRRDEPESIGRIHPQLRGRLDLTTSQADFSILRKSIDFAFCCLPHGASAETVRELADAGMAVVDLSADYRLDDADLYQKVYSHEHPDADRLKTVPYGLPELFREQIRNSKLVANPGCFPTSVLLPLVPLLEGNAVERDDVIIDSKTGVSGGGRTPKLGFHFPECNESVSAYGVGDHRHQPEIENVLDRKLGGTHSVIFTPHLIPMDRGMLSTIYLRPTGKADPIRVLQQAYSGHPFVRIVDELPATKHVSGTHYCNIAVRKSKHRVIVISCLDNLLKGASSAAVQNFNLMNGFDEWLALPC